MCARLISTDASPFSAFALCSAALLSKSMSASSQQSVFCTSSLHHHLVACLLHHNFPQDVHLLSILFHVAASSTSSCWPAAFCSISSSAPLLSLDKRILISASITFLKYYIYIYQYLSKTCLKLFSVKICWCLIYSTVYEIEMGGGLLFAITVEGGPRK
jgi:hypothetical protein